MIRINHETNRTSGLFQPNPTGDHSSHRIICSLWRCHRFTKAEIQDIIVVYFGPKEENKFELESASTAVNKEPIGSAMKLRSSSTESTTDQVLAWNIVLSLHVQSTTSVDSLASWWCLISNRIVANGVGSDPQQLDRICTFIMINPRYKSSKLWPI